MKNPRAIFSIVLVISVLLVIIFTGTNPGGTKAPKVSIHENTVPPPPIGTNISDRFLIGAMNNAFDWDFRYTNELHFNLWHYYTDGEEISGRSYPRGWWWFTGANDRLFDSIGTYKTAVTTQLDNIYSHDGMRSLIMRPKIEYLLYGQRSDYQCEDMSMVNPDLWFYTFQSPSHTGRDIIDGSDTVRYCRSQNSTNQGNWVDNEGMVVSRLRANTEQSRYSDAQGGNQWQSDNECTWLIKPRIRIDSTFAHNNPTTPVCSIKVFKQDGQTMLKNVVLNGRNFLVDGNPQQYYNGRYLEEYRIFPGDDTLKVQGSWGDKWDFKARGNKTPAEEQSSGCNHADIQVWWYGNCDMWIDYVRVDNDIAHDLFSTDPSNLNHQRDSLWIQWEGEDIASHPTGSGHSALKFYSEMFEFNNIPCMAYVSHRLDSITYANTGEHIDVVSDLSFFYSYHLAVEDRASIQNAGHIIRNYIDRLLPSQQSLFEEGLCAS